MLRITMLKLKRAWTLALSLRNRGDTRFPEKFHRLMMVRTAQKSTNSDKDSQWKRKQIIDYLFSPLRTHDEIRRIQSIIISDIRRLQKAINKQNDEQAPQKCKSRIKVSPNAQIDKCNKLITAIFGEEKSLDSGKVSDANAPEREVETVLSTTAKLPEEKLLQKVEVIEETPLVEAEKPKIEGFNTPPRVLGHDLQHLPDIAIDGETAEFRGKYKDKIKSIMVRRLESSEILSKVTPITYGVVNFSGDSSNQGGKSGDKSGRDKADAYDSIAKRLLNTPNNELDKSLIKEMKQLGVPQGSGQSLIKISRDASKKPRKPSEKTEIELEARKFEHEPPASDEDKKVHSAKNVYIRSFQSKPTFVSRLHEEGIRYTEQITPISDDKREKLYNHLEKLPLHDPHKPILQSQNKETDANEKQKAAYLNMVKSKEQPSKSASQTLKLPHKQQHWTTQHPYFQDLTVDKLLNHTSAKVKDRRPQYDPYKVIIPHDKKSIASDTETYGYEPLSYHTANIIEQNKSVKKSEENKEPEKTVVQPIGKTQDSPNVPECPELTLHVEVKTPEPVKIEGQSLITKTPGSFHEEISQYLEVETPEPVKIVGKSLIPKRTGSSLEVTPQQPEPTTQKPNKWVGQPLITKTPGQYPKVTSKDQDLNSELPLYYNANQNYTYFEQFPNQRNVWSSPQSYEPPRTQKTNFTEQDQNDEKSNTAKSEKHANQSPKANQTSGSHPKVTYQAIYLNRNSMPYYNNQNFTNSGPFTNQQNMWSNPKSYDSFRYQIANVTPQNKNDEKLDTEESKKPTYSSSIPNQTSEFNPNVTYKGMYLNREMPYYYNQSYTYSGQFPGQQNFWSSSRETHQQESSTANEKTPASYENLGPNHMFVDKHTDVEAKNIKSEIATLNPAYEHPNRIASDSVEQAKGAFITAAENSNFEKQQSQASNENIPADENPDNIMLDQHKGDTSYDQARQLNPWINPYLSSQESQAPNKHMPADENPDNIFLDQHTGDPSYDQARQLNPLMNPYQNYQDGQAPNENIPADTNPDKKNLDQHTGDPSHEHISQEHASPNITHYLPGMNPYQNSEQQQGQATDTKLPVDANPDNIFLEQHTGDASYEEVSSYPRINQHHPNSPAVAKAGKVEQLHAALYTADPNKGKQGNFPGYSNFPHQFNPWNQYPHSQDQSMSNYPSSEDQEESQDMNQPDPTNTLGNTNRLPPYDAHRPISGHKSYYKKTTDKEIEATENAVPPLTNQTPESQATFYPNLQPLQHPAGLVAQNPYFYQQNFTYFGKYPHQHDFWQNQHGSEDQMSEMYQQQTYPTIQATPEASDQASIYPDQKTPIQATYMRPALRDPKLQPPAGPSAAFISLPLTKWKAGTSLTHGPREALPDEKVQVDYSETISPLPEVDIPSPKYEDLPLSEMLKRVRHRSRQEYIARWTKVDPIEGKCGRKRPRCPPPQPTCPEQPPEPSPVCPPPPPPCPRPCKPKCPCPCVPPTPNCPPPSPPCPTPRCPCCKFVAISLGNTLYNIFTLIWDFGSSTLISKRSLPDCCLEQSSGCSTKAVMTRDIVTQLEILGNHLFKTYGSDLGRYFWKLETLALARGFEPWVPVPSWPIPMEKKKQPFVCPKKGCKERPPPKYGDPCERPCYPGNPCLGFPNKYREH